VGKTDLKTIFLLFTLNRDTRIDEKSHAPKMTLADGAITKTSDRGITKKEKKGTNA